ncbi:MAG: hypothetical protein PGN16_13325 [Sphingomonas phyllosphaerae]|uniref:hypothetical protein n=1 Tax=Sphingomonas phyllosphaerae TaxID=257003 RepID=UPI002FFA0987
METVPNYAVALQHAVPLNNAYALPRQLSAVPPMAVFLAEFHSSMNMTGLRYFSGNVDRFLVFCLLLRTSMSQADHRGTISVHSAAMSLGRPFETVRRHICALLDARVCERTRNGVTLSSAFWNRPENWQQLRYSHDCFVRLIDDAMAMGLIDTTTVPSGSNTGLSLTDGVCAAIDLFLALVDSNRSLCAEPIDLAIFSVVLHANHQLLKADRAMGGFNASAGLLPRHAVRVAQIARALSTPDTTVRRRVAPLTGEHGPYKRTPSGLLVSTECLAMCGRPSESNNAKHGSIRLIIHRAIAAGLSLRDPARSYCDGRPPSPRID